MFSQFGWLRIRLPTVLVIAVKKVRHLGELVVARKILPDKGPHRDLTWDVYGLSIDVRIDKVLRIEHVYIQWIAIYKRM